ncbi:MAG TPA: ATP-binding protein [Candidatus Binatia bacterium]|nr:ATP-binding protein [Candidatus Binatia bacterium]
MVEALTQQVLDLLRANAELQQFASVVSHDLQQPLLAVMTALELLAADRSQGQPEAEAQRCLDTARKGVQQLQTMLADLFTYTRVGAQRQPLQPTDSAAVWQQTLQTFSTQVSESQAVMTADPLPMVRSNELHLTLLFQNLLGNALKFRGPEPPHIHVWARPRGARWVFAVQDNGIGIEAQYAERIFEVFRRGPTTQVYPGTGMGLAICKKIVEQHGGRIWVESEPGQGATFFFTLPAAWSGAENG